MARLRAQIVAARRWLRIANDKAGYRAALGRLPRGICGALSWRPVRGPIGVSRNSGPTGPKHSSRRREFRLRKPGLWLTWGGMHDFTGACLISAPVRVVLG